MFKIKNAKLKFILIIILGLFFVAAIRNHKEYFSGVLFFLKQASSLISDADLSWTMINVNETSAQGDAHFIQIKGGRNVLIDAGQFEPARAKLIPFLKQNGISKIDRVFISHPHLDHYGGINVLMDEGIKIEEIYFNIPNKAICDREIPWGCNYEHILKTHQRLKEYGVDIKNARRNQSIDLGNSAIITVLYAFDGVNTPVGRTDVNDLSLIMMLRYSDYKFLFTGDLNWKIGGYLTNVSDDLTANIIKVPHHGTEALAPNAFFEKVNADYAFIPSPKQLWCSERSKSIRSWFKEKNTPVFINGFHGNVEAVVDKGKLEINLENETNIDCL